MKAPRAHKAWCVVIRFERTESLVIHTLARTREESWLKYLNNMPAHQHSDLRNELRRKLIRITKVTIAEVGK